MDDYFKKKYDTEILSNFRQSTIEQTPDNLICKVNVNKLNNDFIKILNHRGDFSKEKNKVDLPERYIINENATILFWKNGEKTVVKKCEDDVFNPRIAFLTAFFQHYCGMSKNKANKYLASLEIENQNKKAETTGKFKTNNLKVGDNILHKIYGKGKVIEYDDDESFCVEFEKYNNKFHSCGGKGKFGYCLWVGNDDLLEKEKKNG